MIYQIRHTTHYSYPAPVRNSHNELRLMPLSDLWQSCHSFHLQMEPEARTFAYTLPSGHVHHFSHRLPHTSLRIVATSEVETRKSNPFQYLDFLSDDSGFYLQPTLYNDFCEYLDPTERVPNDRYIQIECEQIA
ncbi:transglutaminase N-terminal domain-containing protein, partial [Armatimonas sp.]|uniref:transglutaminase N-terminal domain-containing protein n=1 Tax=Armatimonas sp. TaxID=1872638 RepID=UPI00374C9E33